MLRGARTQTHLQTIDEPRKLARDVLIGVLLLWGIFALWGLEYSSSAIVRQTPSDSKQDLVNSMEAARTALTDERLAAIIQRLHVYPETVRPHGASSAIPYMRSRVSLQPVGGSKNNTGMVRVTYLSTEKAMAINVASALAQSLISATQRTTDLLSADTTATAYRKFEEGGFKLKQSAADGHKSTSQRRPARLTEGELSTSGHPEKQTNERHVVSSAAPVSALSPQASAIKVLQQQIEDAGARLRELQQRYTDQYPDVQDTQEQIQELRSKLSRHQAESALSVPVVLPTREQQTLAVQTLAQEELPTDTVSPETKYEKSSGSLAAERAYALQLARYQSLLSQMSMRKYQDKEAGSSQSLFTLVQPATQAKVAGLAVNPLYWLLSLVAGLLASTLAVLLAYKLTLPAQEQTSLRHQFEPDSLASQYRTGNR